MTVDDDELDTLLSADEDLDAILRILGKQQPSSVHAEQRRRTQNDAARN